jgi:thiamine biosynthesis protein ThiS
MFAALRAPTMDPSLPRDAPTLRLTVNGEPRAFAGPLTVADLLRALAVDARQVAVERNLELVPKARFADTELADADRLEIVTFVGGG